MRCFVQIVLQNPRACSLRLEECDICVDERVKRAPRIPGLSEHLVLHTNKFAWYCARRTLVWKACFASCPPPVMMCVQLFLLIRRVSLEYFQGFPVVLLWQLWLIFYHRCIEEISSVSISVIYPGEIAGFC